MRPFTYSSATTIPEAVATHAGAPATAAPAQFLAGGTTLLDLMKLDVMRPAHLVDVNPLAMSPGGRAIVLDGKGLRLGAFVRMNEAADHAGIKAQYPVLAQTLALAASSGLRNMATLGGNVLQRTRCPYFRDTAYAQCNKRIPGSGCAALDGFNRVHAVLGTSADCIASYPGDFAQSLMVLDASLEIQGRKGPRLLRFGDLHRRPGATPHIETVLAEGDLITALTIPAAARNKRSIYVKIRDRESYEFALASAAVALDLADGNVRSIRIALGGVASIPWRAQAAEDALVGHPITEATARAAAEAAFAEAKALEHNAYKIPLGRETLVRALLQAATMEA